MKGTRSQWILVATTCLIVAASVAQSSADLPPGANGNNWVPISEVAGVLLTNVSAQGAIRFQGFNVETITPQQATGILMVKYGGAWIRVDPPLPQVRVQPLN